MAGFEGQFVWYELMTEDVDAATAFYTAALGWTASDGGMPWRYTVVSVGDRFAGGIMALSDEARTNGARPGWTGYVAVADLEGRIAQAQAAGGVLRHGPADIPNIGRFAVIGDPQGKSFILFTPQSRDGDPPALPPPGTLGHVGWHELHTTDREAALGFYTGLFGWSRAQALDMGPMGTYQIFAVDGVDKGGIMGHAEADRARGWLFYVNVDEIGAAMERVRGAGGQIVHGPQPVPGGAIIAQCLDPQGVAFAMVAMPR